jgi:hypothetical protein
MVAAAGEARCGGGVKLAEVEVEEAHAAIPPSRRADASHHHRDLALGPGQGERGGSPPSALSPRAAEVVATSASGQRGISPLIASMELSGVALYCGAATATGAR